MNEVEESVHFLIKRLKHLLTRLEGEFFHIHPDISENGATTSLALSSILNEALNLHEASFDGDFWHEITKWGKKQNWTWEQIEIRFTYWPVLTVIKPFTIVSDKLVIAGRTENNLVKHKGELAPLKAVLEACGVAWFIILERAREEEIFIDEVEVNELVKLFDCFGLLTHRNTTYGTVISRPLANRVEFPSIRSHSEIGIATTAQRNRNLNSVS